MKASSDKMSPLTLCETIEYVDMVITVLELQTRYFNTRDRATLKRCKELEAKLLKASENLLQLLKDNTPRTPVQNTLFDIPQGLPD